MATKAATRGNILHGFYKSGLIDRTKSRYPVLLKILGTCRSTLPKELYQKVFDNFTYLYSVMMDQGHILEDVFGELGFPQDRDVNGKEVLRNAGISQESQQRSKWLTHQFQIKLQKEHILRIETAQRRKFEQHIQKIEEDDNHVKEIEMKLLSMLNENMANQEAQLDFCTVEMFDQSNSSELAGFIWAHDPSILLKKDIPSNKEKLADAAKAIEHNSTADNNRIFTAYMCQNLPNILASKQKKPPRTAIIPIVPVLEQTFVSLSDGQESKVLSSTIMSSQAWISQTCELFGVAYLLPSITVTNTIKGKADFLAKLLRGCMKSFLKRRIESEKKNSLGISTCIQELVYCCILYGISRSCQE